VPRNFNEGVDPGINAWLAALTTANKLWACLVTQGEADIDPTIGLAALTRVGGTASKTGCASVSRAVDLGALAFTGDCSTAKAVVVTDRDPTVGGAKAILIQDLNGGAALGAPAAAGAVIDGLTLKFVYPGEP
jgi:hypothetical protein